MLNQNRNLNQSCILAQGVLEERRRRKGGGACSEMPGGHVWGWAYFFFWGGGGACFFLWFTYDAASKRIKALPNREQ